MTGTSAGPSAGGEESSGERGGGGGGSRLGQDSPGSGLPHRSRIRPETEAAIAALARDGASASRVGKALSVPEGTAKRWMWERGLGEVAKAVRAERRLALLRRHASAERFVREIRTLLANEGLKIETTTLQGMLDANGLPYRPRRSLPQEVVATIERDLVAGISHRDIAKASGVETSDVKRISDNAIRGGKLKPRKSDRPWTEADVQRLVQLASAGTTHRMIAGLLNRSQGAVTAKLFVLKEEAVAPKPISGRGRFRRWSREDEATILSLKSDRLGLAAIAEATSRSPRAIKDRLQRLSGQAQRKWSEADRRELVRLHLADATPADIARAIGRSIHVVQAQLSRCRQQGLLPPIVHPWPEADVSTLLRLAREGRSDLEVATTLGLPVAAVRLRADKLHHEGLLEVRLRRQRVPRAPSHGPRRRRRPRVWTEAADARLLELDSTEMPVAEIAKHFDSTAGSEAKSIRKRIPAKQARSRWSEADDLLLLNLDGEAKSEGTIAEFLGRTESAVSSRLHALRSAGKLTRAKRVHRVWSEDADARLLPLVADGKSDAEIAGLIGTTESAVTSRKHALRRAGKLAWEKRGSWSETADARLLTLDREGNCYAEIAEAMGRTERSVKQRLHKLRRDGKLTRPARDVRPWSGSDDAHLLALDAEERNPAAIAEATGRTPNAVKQRLFKLRRDGMLVRPKRHRGGHGKPKKTLGTSSALQGERSRSHNESRVPESTGAVVGTSMVRSDLMTRLMHKAAQIAEARKESAIKRGVRTFLRVHLEEVHELKRRAGTWNDVAALLTEEGLRWRSGAKVTGSQLRALVAQIEKAEHKKPFRRR